MGVALLPERLLRREELPEAHTDEHGRTRTNTDNGKAMLKYFVPFKSFFGGWLVYELAGKLWRQYAVPAEMRKAGVGFTRPI